MTPDEGGGEGRGLASGESVLLADVGNSRIKLARLGEAAATGSALPTITHRQDLDSHSFHPENLERWLSTAAPGPTVIVVASVSEAAATRLEAALAEISATRHRPIRQRRIGPADLPLEVRLPAPERVGIDRLAGAAACRLLLPAGVACVVIDCGTAATVDLVSADGAFLGGAILPGPSLMARALAEGTSRLPAVRGLGSALPPAMPGRTTEEAIAAGIGLGIQGAIARLEAEARTALGPRVVTVLTGGWRAAVRGCVTEPIEVPDLVLAGVALAVARACAR
jgi:type III pantothenate kinase